MPDSLGDAAQTRAIIEQAIKATYEVEGNTRDFVTRAELGRDMSNLEKRLEVKLENSMLKTRNWVLGGIVASGLMFGWGFVSMMSRFDRTADAVLLMQKSMESRRDWIDENNERDRRQDDALQSVKPSYTPMPFEVRPR